MRETRTGVLLASLTAAAAMAAFPAWADDPEFDFSGYLEPELQFYFDGREPEQEFFNSSIAAQLEFELLWNRGETQIVVVPFGRVDQNDSRRSHWDIREMKFLHVIDGIEIRAGVDKVFWGVTEAVHFVDIINQDDLVESIDAEEKLGQPMVSVAVPTDYGLFKAFWLPYFRERTFPGIEGRPRIDLPVALESARFESAAAEWHQDFAFRWSNFIGPVDIGLAYFHGTGRDPLLILEPAPGGGVQLVPFYPQIQQGSIDAQATFDAWLIKFEGLVREELSATYFQATGGLEYTFFGIFGAPDDLGVVLEYAYDSRGTGGATQPFANDVFAGLRWAANDVASTTVLAGVVVDASDSTFGAFVEASRRLGDDYLLSLELRLTENTPPASFQASFEDEDFVQVRLARYF